MTIKNLPITIILLFAWSLFFFSCSNIDDSEKVEETVPPITLRTMKVYSNGNSSFSGGIIANLKENTVLSVGICWSKKTLPTINDFSTSDSIVRDTFSCQLSNLEINTTYYVRSFATTEKETVYGNAVRFTTSDLPKVATIAITELIGFYALSGGTILSSGRSPITSKGLCWSNLPDPTIELKSKVDAGADSSSYSLPITGISPGGTYYVRAFATNANGTSYGEQIEFKTPAIVYGAAVKDIDGNSYPTVAIGSQTWMTCNLKTKRYRNGDLIGSTVPANWSTSSEINPKYQWSYWGDETKVNVFGRLYTWFAINDNRNIAPLGWHVATDADWKKLQNYLIANKYNYDYSTTGNRIGKALASTSSWVLFGGTGNIGCELSRNNYSGFSAEPSGVRLTSGNFEGLYGTCVFWTSTQYNESDAFALQLNSNYSDLYPLAFSKHYGCSVRCIKD